MPGRLVTPVVTDTLDVADTLGALDTLVVTNTLDVADTLGALDTLAAPNAPAQDAEAWGYVRSCAFVEEASSEARERSAVARRQSPCALYSMGTEMGS